MGMERGLSGKHHLLKKTMPWAQKDNENEKGAFSWETFHPEGSPIAKYIWRKPTFYPKKKRYTS